MTNTREDSAAELEGNWEVAEVEQPNMPTLTASDIAAIVPGAVIRRIINGTASRWQPVRSIHARGTSVQGKAYVCGYTEFTPYVDGKGGSEMSFSVAEDETIVEIQSSPLWDAAA